MGVWFDLHPRVSASEAEAVANTVKNIFLRSADEISRGWGQRSGKIFDAMDGTKARAELDSLKQSYNDAALAEERAAQRMVRAVGTVEAAWLKADETARKFGVNSSQYAGAINKMTDAQAVAAVATKGHVDAMIATEGASKALTTAHNDAASATTKFGTAVNVAGAVGVAGLGLAMATGVKQAGDFQEGLVRLQTSADETGTAIGGLSGNLQEISDGVIKLTTVTGYQANDLMSHMYGVEKAGFRGADAVKVMGSAAQLARIENADLGNTVDGLTTSLNDFNIGADQSVDVAAKLRTAVGQTKGTIDEFTGALHNVEPVARTFMGANENTLDQIYTIQARMSQSGEGLDQASQNVRNAIEHMGSMNLGPQRDAISALGLNPDDLAKQMNSPDGFINVMKTLSDTIGTKLTPNQQVVMSDMYQSAQAAETQTKMLAQMPPKVREMSEALKNGTISHKDYMKAARGSSDANASMMASFDQSILKSQGFSNNLKKNQSDVETVGRIWRDVTGTDAGLTVAAQLVGTPELLKETLDLLQKVKDSHADQNGMLPGFSESMDTLNNKMRVVKAAFGDFAIELGTAFVPALTHMANGAKDVGNFLAENKGIAEGLIYTLGGLAGAWALVKTAMLMQDAWGLLKGGISFITDTAIPQVGLLATEFQGLGPAAAKGAAGVETAADAEAAAMGRVEVAAGTARTALLGVASLAATVVAYTIWADNYEKDHPAPRNSTDGATAAGRGGLARGIGPALDGTRGADPNDDGSGFAGIDTGGNAGTTPEQQRAGTLARQQGRTGLPDAPALPPGLDAADGSVPDNGIVGDPGGGGSGGKSKKKSPEGTKEDPIYMAPIGSSGGGLGGNSNDPWDRYNPLEEHGKGGLLQQLTQMGTTFLAELALGNPLGQLMKAEQARRSRGESRSNPMYVVDANGNVMTKDAYDNYKRNFEIGQDQKVYDYDVKTYGADSAEAIAAQRELTKAQQEYAANLKAQAYDPRGGGAGGAYPGDAALLANVPAGHYSQAPDRDLIKGLSDCSSSVGDLVNIMDGRTGGEKLTTANAAQWLPAHGFLPGMGGPGDFRVGYNGGHMQATLPGGTNWNYGSEAAAQSRGIAPNTGADDPAFTSHYYRPALAGGGAPGPVGGLYGAANTNPALNNPMAPQGGDGAALPNLADVPRYFGNGAPIKPGATTGYQGTRTPLGVMGTPKQNTGTGQGLGIGGGLLGLLMNAGSEAGAAAGAMPGLGAGGAAAGQVAQIALQEANRFAGYLGQLGGIAVSGLQETFLPDLPQTGTLSKIFGGLAGAHPVTTDTADQAQQGQTPYDPNTNGQQPAPQLGADPDKQKGQDKDQQGGDQQPNIGNYIENYHQSPGSPDYLNLSKYGAGMTP